MSSHAFSRELRIGTNIVYLMHMRSRLERNGIDIQPLLQILSAHFAEKRSRNGWKKYRFWNRSIGLCRKSVIMFFPHSRQNAAIAGPEPA